jgi:hypothetical protein
MVMPTNDFSVFEVTAVPTFHIVGDRLRFILRSGECTRTYSIPFSLARRAIANSTVMLDDHDRTVTRRVKPLRKASG